MKTTLLSVLFVLTAFSGTAQTATFHDFEAETILGDVISMSQYAGKKLLVVNTASFCAYTPQFEELEALDSTYESYNFKVIGFPCNDFGSQDPGTNEEILQFCQGTYGVTFQMMSRISITASDTCDIYKWLQLGSQNGVSNANVTWNFHKFCIDEYGHWVMHFPQQIHPNNQQIVDWIMSETPAQIDEKSGVLDWKILGNPASSFTTLQFGSTVIGTADVMIYSMDGRLINTVFHGELNGRSLRLETGDLPSGLYLITVRNGQSQTSRRLTIIGE